MESGLKPIKHDKRDYSYSRTFGTLALPDMPLEYNCDAGLTMPDQNAEGRPYGCTGYTQAELASDEDQVAYNPGFTYDKTRYLEGTEGNVGCDLRTSLESTIVYGVQRHDETTDGEALQHRRGQYFHVTDNPNLDAFDDIKTTLWNERASRRSISIGTPWFNEWSPGRDGILSENFVYDFVWFHYAWHNWKICGWKVVNGEQYLIGKSWQGRNYGDGGWVYLSRKAINKVMLIDGCGAYTLAKARPEHVRNIQLTLAKTALKYMLRLLRLRLGL